MNHLFIQWIVCDEQCEGLMGKDEVMCSYTIKLFTQVPVLYYTLHCHCISLVF